MSGCQQMVQQKRLSRHRYKLKTSSSCKVKSGYEHLSKAAVPFTWVQQQEEFDIELTGILGAGKTQISGTPGQVTLNSAKTGLIKAATAEELLQRATGWQAD